MPSSGLGNSFDSEYRKCQRKFYYGTRLGLALQSARVAPPLLIGEAIHKYAETFLKAWMAGSRDKDTVKAESLGEFNTIVGTPDPELDIDLLEREQLARAVLPFWAERKWERLAAGAETPLAVEVAYAMPLPADTDYGPIRAELRTYTVKIDYVFTKAGGLNCVCDHKGTGALSLAQESLHYLMSDQHLGYVFVWNWANPSQLADTLMYDMMRLHAKVTSPHAFHVEERNVDLGAQLDDWYQRMLYVRAELSNKWDQPPVAWISNTVPHGPCLSYGRACEFTPLCKRPSDVELLMETKYRTEAP